MKNKIITSIISTILVVSPISSFAFSVSPSNYNSTSESPISLIFSDIDIGDNILIFSDIDNFANSYVVENTPFEITDYIYIEDQFNYNILKFSSEPECLTGGDLTYANCKLDNSFVAETVITYTTQNTALSSGVLFGRSGESQEVNQSGGSLLAAVGTVSTDSFSSVFPYLMLSVGVFVGLYIIQKFVIMWGAASGEKIKFNKIRGWTGKGAIEHDVIEFKKKRRSRIKRDLE